jgi:hypothetical protein
LNQETTGLGVLLENGTLTVPVLFCPTDTEADIGAEYAKYRDRTSDIAWCSYLYRQLDGQADKTQLNDKLVNLGNNAAGKPIRALIMDMQCTMEWNGLPIKRNHDGKTSCIGFTDGSAAAFPLSAGQLTLEGSTSMVPQTLDKMLEQADALSP